MKSETKTGLETKPSDDAATDSLTDSANTSTNSTANINANTDSDPGSEAKEYNPVATRISGADVIAGISVALVIIPQSLAYAQLAGLPASAGLFAAALPLLVFALFASSPFLQTGPVALTSLLTFAALTGGGLEPGTEQYVAGAMLLALMVAVLRFGLGLSRLGKIADLISKPVLQGFTNAAAIIILASQLPKAIGADGVIPEDLSTLRSAFWAITHPSAYNPAALGVAGVTLFFMFGGRKLHKLFPGVLLAAVLFLVISASGFYDGTIIGDPNPLPEGLPGLSFDFDFGLLSSLITGALIVALVGFAEPTAIAKTFAEEHNQRWSVNRELMASGAANFVAAISGALPVGGSFSRSALNKLAGAQSRWSGMVTGLVVLAFLPFASILNELPQAVLGAVVVGAAIKLVKPNQFKDQFAASKIEGAIMVITFVATLAFAPQIHWALLIGVAATYVARLVKHDPNDGRDSESAAASTR